jgi:formylglycine-generating enzyme required for sulfatase activity
LLLALGEVASLNTAASKLVPLLEDWYRNDIHGGVHGATKWLLRREVGEDVVIALDQQLAREPRGARQWYVKEIGGEFVTFIVLEPSQFQMGSPSAEAQRQADEVQHRVSLTRRIAIADSQVRRRDYDPHQNSTGPRFSDIGECSPTANHPMIWITWRDAIKYCNWATKVTGMSDEACCYVENEGLVGFSAVKPGFRLPTEAEREFACRAGSPGRFSFGEDESLLRSYGYYLDNALLQTHPPGELFPNALGLFDMHGNTYDWCSDWYGPYDVERAVDPTGPSTGDVRVLRGGGWNYGPRDARCAHRYFSQEHNRNAKIGFRLVQSLA